MQVKIFEAADMTTGLKQIREELGPDALILSTRTRREGPLGLLGKPVVEITAAIDDSPPLAGNAVTMAERNILTGGGQVTDILARTSARARANSPVHSPLARKRIDLTVGANEDLLADLQPLEKSPIVATKPSPAKSQASPQVSQSPRRDAPPEAKTATPGTKPADDRQQLLAALSEDSAAKVLTNKKKKNRETAKTPTEQPPKPKKASIKKRDAIAATPPEPTTPEPAPPENGGQATGKKIARRRTEKKSPAKNTGIATQNGAPLAAPPKRKRSPSKASTEKSAAKSAAKLATKPAAKPAVKPAARPADFFTGSLRKTGEQAAEAPPHILSYLKNRGIETEAAQALACHAGRVLPLARLHDPQAVRRCLLDAIQNFISVAPPDFSGGAQQRRIALVGPTGVGKTTTIAKLAAWYLARQHGKLTLITIDTYRIAAVEQLKVYGEIMRLPVEVVMNPPQLATCLQKHRDADMILIDTSGHSPQNAEMVAELGEFFAACPAIERHLVLSATTRENELLHSLRAFQPLDVERTIFTKIDECSNLGVLLNVQLHNAQPLSFLTNGQRVPEDLLEIDRRSVAELILSEGAARHA